MATKTRNEEIDALREQTPDLGVDALGDLGQLAEDIIDAVDYELYRVDADSDIRALYIVGSFAEGTATRDVSDLDVRVVISDAPDIWTVEKINERLRVEHGPKIVPDAAGFLDAHLRTAHPDNYTHVRLPDTIGDDP